MKQISEMQAMLAERESLYDRIGKALESREIEPGAPLFDSRSDDAVRAIERDLESLRARENAFVLRLRGR